MRNEDKLTLAQKYKENQIVKQAVIDEARAIEAYTEQRKVELSEIKQSIESLAEVLNVTVDFPDIHPLMDKLKGLDQLPDSFTDIKNMSMAISNKLQIIADSFQKKDIVTVRGFAEANERFKRIENNTEKFADLNTYLQQLTETLKQGQRPEDYKPIRIVVGGDGTPLDFLKHFPTSRGGGGSSSGGGAVTQGTSPWVVSADSLPLPSGAATSAKQDTQTSSLQSLDNYRSGATKTPVVATVTDSGDTTVHNPASGKAIRLYWFSALNDPDNETTPLIKIGFGPSTSITTELYRVYAMAHYEVFESAADENLIVNLSGAASVACTFHLEEYTP